MTLTIALSSRSLNWIPSSTSFALGQPCESVRLALAIFRRLCKGWVRSRFLNITLPYSDVPYIAVFFSDFFRRGPGLTGIYRIKGGVRAARISLRSRKTAETYRAPGEGQRHYSSKRPGGWSRGSRELGARRGAKSCGQGGR